MADLRHWFNETHCLLYVEQKKRRVQNFFQNVPKRENRTGFRSLSLISSTRACKAQCWLNGVKLSKLVVC